MEILEFFKMNYEWVITTFILFCGLIVSIISLRRNPPSGVVKIVRRGDEPSSGIGMFILGGLLGIVIGWSMMTEDKE